MKTIIKLNDDDFKKAKNTLKGDTYDTQEVREYLEKTYWYVCCYCESKFDYSATFNIEHFYPKWAYGDNWKLKYKHFKIDLNNLHYACPKCNYHKSYICPDWKETYKKDKSGKLYGSKIYSPNYILIDWELSMPKYKIEDKFKYEWAIIKVLDNYDKRWEWTISIFNLNNENKVKSIKEERLPLINNRKKYFVKAVELFELIEKNIKSNNNMLIYLIRDLWNMMEYDAPYSSMIKYHFLELYIELLEQVIVKKKS